MYIYIYTLKCLHIPYTLKPIMDPERGHIRVPIFGNAQMEFVVDPFCIELSLREAGTPKG